jgi:peptide/nickel transport system permease protein
MSFKPVILWTDALIYLLVAVIIAFIFYARRGGKWVGAAWPWLHW